MRIMPLMASCLFMLFFPPSCLCAHSCPFVPLKFWHATNNLFWAFFGSWIFHGLRVFMHLEFWAVHFSFIQGPVDRGLFCCVPFCVSVSLGWVVGVLDQIPSLGHSPGGRSDRPFLPILNPGESKCAGGIFVYSRRNIQLFFIFIIIMILWLLS